MITNAMTSIVSDIHTGSTVCFLNSIVETPEEVVYLIFYTDNDLQLIETAYVNKETLEKIPRKGLITNFIVQDGFLRCDALPKMRVEMPAEKLLGKSDCISFRFADVAQTSSFFSFLSNASNYIYVDEDSLTPNDEDDQIKYKLGEYGYTNFSNLKFSQTTMTAYFHVVTPNGLENRNIIYLNDKNYLQMNEFIIGTKALDFRFPEECATFLGEAMDPNGKIYTLYKVKMMSLYENIKFSLDNNLINLSCYMSLRYDNALNLLDAIIESVAKQEDYPQITWAGGTNSHKSNYGVLFKSTGEKYSKTRCVDLINTVMQGYIVPALKEDADKEIILQKVLQELINPGVNDEEKHLRTILANIMVMCESPEDILETAIKYKEQFKHQKFNYDKFLYWVRCYLYLNRLRITVPGRPVIHSNFIKASTVVTEGIFYGEHR